MEEQKDKLLSLKWPCASTSNQENDNNGRFKSSKTEERYSLDITLDDTENQRYRRWVSFKHGENTERVVPNFEAW